MLQNRPIALGKFSSIAEQTCMLNRLGMFMVIAAVGCSPSRPPQEMYPPEGVPNNVESIDPWIASLLDANVPKVTGIVHERLKSGDPQLAPIVNLMSKFTPCQVAFSSQRGHVRCVRQYLDTSSNQTRYDVFYLVQPLDAERLQARVASFDEALRPTMFEFLSRFAGSGEEMTGAAGQFSYDSWPTAEEFGYADKSSLGTWKDATLFYHSINGDAVFIKPSGATAWRVLETDETIPIATTFAEFIKLYADIRGTHVTFDSWAYRDFIARRKKE